MTNTCESLEAQVTYEEKHEDHNEIAKPVTDQALSDFINSDSDSDSDSDMESKTQEFTYQDANNAVDKAGPNVRSRSQGNSFGGQFDWFKYLQRGHMGIEAAEGDLDSPTQGKQRKASSDPQAWFAELFRSAKARGAFK